LGNCFSFSDYGIVIRIYAIEDVASIPFVYAAHFVGENVGWQVLQYFILAPLHAEKLARLADIKCVLGTAKTCPEDLINLRYLLGE